MVAGRRLWTVTALFVAVATCATFASGEATSSSSSYVEAAAESLSRDADIDLSALAAAELADMALDVGEDIKDAYFSFEFTDTLDGHLRTPFLSLDNVLKDLHDKAGEWDFWGSSAAKWAVQNAVSGARTAATAALNKCREILKLTTHRYMVSVTGMRINSLRADPLSIKQMVAPKHGLEFEIDGGAGFEIDVVVSRSRRDGQGTTRGFVKGTLYSQGPVSARITGTAVPTGTSEDGGVTYTTEPKIELHGDLVGNVRVRAGSVETLDPAVNELESTVEGVAGKTKSAADTIRSWRDGRLASMSDTVKGLVTRLANLMETAERKVLEIKTKINELAAWCLQEALRLAFEARDRYVVQPLQQAVGKSISDTLAASGSSVHELLLRDGIAEASDAFSAAITDVQFNNAFTNGRLGTEILRRALAPIMVQATKMEEVRTRHHLWRRALQRGGEQARRAARHHAALESCAKARCEMDKGEGADGHCTGDPLTRYMALFQRVHRSKACFQGRIIPQVLMGVVEIVDAEPFCCDPTGRAHKKPCGIAMCSGREDLQEAVLASAIEVTKSKRDYDKIEAAPEIWGDEVYAPVVPTSVCEDADEREGTSLWVRFGAESDESVLDVKIVAGSPEEVKCPSGYRRISRTYLGHGTANLRGTAGGAAHSDNRNGLYLCIKSGPYGNGAVTGIKFVDAAAAAGGGGDAQQGTVPATGGNPYLPVTKTVSGLDASFTPRPGCDAVYVALQRATVAEDDILIPHEERMFYHDSRDGTGLARSSGGASRDAEAEEAALQVFEGMEDELVQVLGRSPTAEPTGTAAAVQEARRARADSGHLGFGIAIDPPAPEMFPGLKLRVWLHDVKPLSYLRLKDMGFEYKEDIPYTALDGRTSAGSGPGFEARLDIDIAAEASIVVLGTEMFTTLTIAEVLAILAPRNGKLDAAKYPGPNAEQSALFATDGPAGLAVAVAARCQLWHQGGAGEGAGWRLRISQLTLKKLDVKFDSQRQAVNIARDALFEGLDAVEILRDMLDLKGLEVAIAALDDDGGLGVMLEQLRGKNAIAKGSVAVNIPEHMLKHNGVFRPAYVAIRDMIRGQGGDLVTVSE